MDGVVNAAPVPMDVPPVETVNQFNVPAEAVAAKFTVPVPHLFPGAVLATVGVEFTVKSTSDEFVVPQSFVVIHLYLYVEMAVVAPVIVKEAVVVVEYGAVFVKFVQVEPPFVLTCH